MAQFNEYYQDELAYLREMGEEFSDVYPRLAPYLANEGSDPDVERLLEGFAFLTARLRQKLDDEFPEFTEDLFSIVEPQFLRPLPSAAILQFEPIENAVTESKLIEAGIYIDSMPVDGTPCRFQTAYDVELLPIELAQAKFESTGLGTELSLNFNVLSGQSTDSIELSSLPIYLNGDWPTVTSLFLWFSQYIEKIELSVGEGPYQQSVSIDRESVVSVGFDERSFLYPNSQNSHPAYLQLIEYFAFPQKYMFKKLDGLEKLATLPGSESFSIRISFNRPFEAQLRPTADNFKLFCSPIVNLFAADAEPIRHEHKKMEYRVRPAGEKIENYEVYSIEKVSGWIQGARERRDYLPFLNFRSDIRSDARSAQRFFQSRRVPAIVGKGYDSYIRFTAEAENNEIHEEVVSIELICCNRGLAEKLRVGDICVATSDSPEFASFKNLTIPTPVFSSPNEGELYWRLLSNMSITHESLADVNALKQIINTYNFAGFHSKQNKRDVELKLDALQAINKSSKIELIHGAPVRGIEFEVVMDGSKFSSEGDMYLFASVLNEFFSLHASINSFVSFRLLDQYKGETYKWKHRSGQIPLL
jgi:type VI secretion system protein ImpG